MTNHVDRGGQLGLPVLPRKEGYFVESRSFDKQKQK